MVKHGMMLHCHNAHFLAAWKSNPWCCKGLHIQAALIVCGDIYLFDKRGGRGSARALQAALVVYDEIHYLRDKERGVVWEESIVLMPKSVRFAFLSATIPNAMEFAEWIAKTHR